MKRRTGFLPAFLVVVFLCIVILVLSISGNLKFLSSFLEKRTARIQGITLHIFKSLPFISRDEKIKRLEEKNLELLSRVADFEKLKKENQALSDQFQTSYPSSYKLLKTQIIGDFSFIPGVSAPNVFILNKGANNDIKVGSAVVIKDNLVGVISQISENLSKVNLINNSSLSFTARTQNGAFGIIRGGESLILDSILLSENISPSEIVFTKGDIDSNGVGIPPDLVVGKITSVEKKPSDLFQKAKVESFINLVNLSTVFVYMQSK